MTPSLNHLTTEDLIDELHRRLMVATVASCRCLTKTDDPAHHNGLCPYRLLATAGERLDEVKELAQGILI